LSFLFGKKNNSEKDDAANKLEFDELADTVRVIYEQALAEPEAALNRVKNLLARIKIAPTLDKRQRDILSAFAHDTAGFAHLELNRPEEALAEMEKAVRTYQALPDKTPLVNNYLNQSRAWMMRNNIPRTFVTLERGLEFAKKNDLPKAEADVLYKLGVLYSLTDQSEKAQEILRRGLLLVQQLNDRVASASFLAQLGQLNLQQNDFEKAEDYLLSSQAVFEEYGEADNLLQTYSQLGQLYRRKEDYTKALEIAAKGLELARRQQNRREENNFLQDFGMFSYLQDDYEAALRYGLESLQHAEQNTDQDNKLRAYSLLTQIAILRKEFGQADHYAASGYDLAKTSGERREQAIFLNNFAEIKLAQDDTKGGLDYLEQVHTIFKELKDLPALAALYVRIGDIYLDKLNDPVSTAQQAERSFQASRTQPGETGMFAFTAALQLWQNLAERGFYKEALESAGQCLGVANNELQSRSKERKNPQIIAEHHFWLLFVQVLMILVATLQDLTTNKTAFRPKVDEVLGQLKERFGDTFTLDTWANEMYARIK
jgi:tetratricopeptide (TPR) repeat protein